MSRSRFEWDRLEASTVADRLRAKRLREKPDVFIAKDHVGQRHLLIALAAPEDGFSDERSRGLLVQVRELEVEDQESVVFLDVWCRDTSQNDLFDVVVSDILDLIDAGRSARDSVAITLARWRRFWGRAPHQHLSPEAAIGLFGELWFLCEWLLPHGEKNVVHWRGPRGSLHDFVWDHQAVEVKTTASRRGHVHRITGLQQLDPLSRGGKLYVFSLRVNENSPAGSTLPGLIRRIEQKLAGHPGLLDELEDRLAAAGYSPVHREHYEETSYEVADERLYIVDDTFPRLTRDVFRFPIPAGVEMIEYTVNLDACPQCIVARSPHECPVAFLPDAGS